MRIAPLLLALMLTACAGTNFKWEDVSKVHEGMTEAEVVAVLGPPYSRVQSGPMTILNWTFVTAFGGAKAVSYRLLDGKVAGTTTLRQP